MNVKNHYDMLVIGSGPAGKRAVVQAAKLGKRAAVIERADQVGGVSVHTGTIPSKTLRETALYLSGFRQRTFYGNSFRLKEDLCAEDLFKRVDMTRQYEVQVMENQFYRNGANVIQGSASFIDDHTIEVTNCDKTEIYSADYILIATGTHPFRPDNIPFDGCNVVDSDEILNIKEIPRSLAVIGAGVIGIEYATIFAALDTQITVIDVKEKFLEFIDKEIVDELEHEMRGTGATFCLGDTVEDIRVDEQGLVTTLLKSGRTVVTDMVLFASGRSGTVQELNLDKAGLVADSRGRINVNDDYQTDIAHIYAAGDVVGFPALAATSMEQGRHATCHAFDVIVDNKPRNFPYGIYSVPEVSMVGMTEQEVKSNGIAYEVGVARFGETSRGLISGRTEGMLKMIFGIDDGKLLGVHIIGEGATELIHIGQAIFTLEQGIDYFIETTFNYPTLAEAYKIAALNAWNRMSARQ
ncbi:MAG: Si-specific NAD(P)(+) transhydrogenase [Gammaproteobacteria bacterium]